MLEDLAWNHNACYHRYLTRHIPPGAKRALDVGCGTGAFARDLARRGLEVDAYDRSAADLAKARAIRASSPESARIRYIKADVLNTELAPEAYDVVACLATVHHMPFATAINKLPDALAPGGVLLLLGLFRDSTPADLAIGLAAVPAELAVGGTFRMRRLLRDRGRPRGVPPVSAPTPPEPLETAIQPTLMEPQMTLPEIQKQAVAVLPGCSIRRHLFWRYSLVYRKPSSSSP
ncbi:class I SAM-dependent methyltransferase [Streptomyces sp. NPDC048483]|uniref:class I SAM-dependent methyltransferase n=1 Tax=Streptomyces sp. NPDC048483 TaxID=3154927 RepID=UPI00342ECF20